MAITLTKEEKTAIINSHQKNVLLNKYNIEVSILEENAKNAPDASVLADLNSQIQEADNKLATLQEELDSLA